MSRSLCLLGAIFIFAAGAPVSAEDAQPGINQTRSRMLILDIETRIIEESEVIVWNEIHRRVTIPGSPVSIKLVGANIVVSVQFTPFIRRQGNVLVALGQIWVEEPGKGIAYYTSMQAIPMDFGEAIFFFPLGQSQQLDESIEIMLTVNLYNETILNPAGTAANTGNDR